MRIKLVRPILGPPQERFRPLSHLLISTGYIPTRHALRHGLLDYRQGYFEIDICGIYTSVRMMGNLLSTMNDTLTQLTPKIRQERIFSVL